MISGLVKYNSYKNTTDIFFSGGTVFHT